MGYLLWKTSIYRRRGLSTLKSEIYRGSKFWDEKTWLTQPSFYSPHTRSYMCFHVSNFSISSGSPPSPMNAKPIISPMANANKLKTMTINTFSQTGMILRTYFLFSFFRCFLSARLDAFDLGFSVISPLFCDLVCFVIWYCSLL